jgi:hypothetical protein
LAGLALVALGAEAAHESHNQHHETETAGYYQYQPNDRDLSHYQQRYDRNETLGCDSINDGYDYCRATIRNAHVRLLRQYSQSACRFGEDWGYDARGVWVDNGCRATFEIEY